jgi:hypothetical protein
MSSIKKCSGYLKERIRIPRLTIKGIIIQCSDNIASTLIEKFDWADAIIDASIVSGLTFFSTLSGGSVAGLDGLPAFKAAAIAASAQFFIFLALKRGIVQSKQATP